MIGRLAVDALSHVLKTAAGTRIVYRRGQAAAEVDATVGQSEFGTADSLGEIVERFYSRDYFVDAADLTLAGVRILPARGDLIIETIGEVSQTYQVISPSDSEKPFRFCDASQTRLRIHTKKIA